jgi:hypothetical protein
MRCAVFVSLVLLFPFLQPAHAQDPVFITGFRIQDGGADLQVSYAGAPAAVDWNNDGTKDLVVGQETRVRISTRYSTDTAL